MSSIRLSQLKAFLEDQPNDSFILFAIAKEYEKLGDDDNALSQYLELLESDLNYVGTYYHLAKLYERKESFSKAFFTYKAGMKIAKSQSDQHAYNELAGAKLALGDDEDFEMD